MNVFYAEFIVHPIIRDKLTIHPIIRDKPTSFVFSICVYADTCLFFSVFHQVRARVDLITVGKLSMNLTTFTRESVSIFGNELTSAIQNLLPYTQAIPLTVEYLNTATLQPRKDNQTGR